MSEHYPPDDGWIFVSEEERARDLDVELVELERAELEWDIEDDLMHGQGEEDAEYLYDNPFVEYL